MKILIVDDQVASTSFVRRLVEAAYPDAEIEVCHTEEEACEAVEEGPVDLVISDLAISRHIKSTEVIKMAAQRGIPVIVYSGFASQILVERAFNSGACAFVFKSSVDHHLIHAIEHFASLKHYRCPALLACLSKEEVDHGKPLMLSRSEEAVIELYVKGYSLKEIAPRLNLTYNTVRSYARNAADANGVSMSVLRRAYRKGYSSE